MARDNSSSQLDNHSHQTKERSTSVQFENETEISLEPNWQNKERKYRRAMFAEEDCDNTAA